MSFTVAQIARFYRINAVDYERPGASGLLIGAGTGMMMSVMDEVPSLRYCIDTDIMRPDEWERFPDWLTLMERACSFVASAGWWSRPDNGLKLAEALKVLRTPPYVYYGILERPSDWMHCRPLQTHRAFTLTLNGRYPTQQ